MTERLLKGGHRVVDYARHRESIERVEKKGAVGANSLEELVVLSVFSLLSFF